MTPEEYLRFVGDWLSPQSLTDPELVAVLGLVGESGELADLAKKQRFHGHDYNHIQTMQELGDVFFYAFVMLYACSWTFEEVIAENMRKLKERYPDGFDEERSMNRGR